MTGLGRTISVHPGQFAAGGWLWYIGGILILSGVYGGAQAATAGAGPDEVMTSLAALVVGLFVLVVPVLRWRQSVLLHEHGVVLKKLTGEETLSRNDIVSVQSTRHHTKMGTYDEIEVTLANGGSRTLSGVAQAEQLANFMRTWAQGGAGVQAPAGWVPPGGGIT